MMWGYGYSSGHNVRLHGFFRFLHWEPWGVLAAALAAIAFAGRCAILLPSLIGLCVLATAIFPLLRSPWAGCFAWGRRIVMLCLMLLSFNAGYFHAIARVRAKRGDSDPKDSTGKRSAT